jgi:hydrogenase-1 operon protein HyaF
MKDFPFPVRAIGPGSQPSDDEELQYLAMPRDMNTFRMPLVPERADLAALREARDVFAAFAAQLETWHPELGADGPRIELTGAPPPVLAVVNEMLGEGEVAIRIDGERGFRIQESVFTGLWRVFLLDREENLVADWLEASALPSLVIELARSEALLAPPLVELPADAMNSPSLLAEIGSQMAARAPGAPAHVINLTLFPLTADDHQVMAKALPVGRVAMISRGFGNCRISSTATRDVWRVQYFNSMSTLILNTIEVVDVPEVALAAVDDLVDSRVRLAELIEWMDESAAEAEG